jgi:hypothetical protein
VRKTKEAKTRANDPGFVWLVMVPYLIPPTQGPIQPLASRVGNQPHMASGQAMKNERGSITPENRLGSPRQLRRLTDCAASFEVCWNPLDPTCPHIRTSQRISLRTWWGH